MGAPDASCFTCKSDIQEIQKGVYEFPSLHLLLRFHKFVSELLLHRLLSSCFDSISKKLLVKITHSSNTAFISDIQLRASLFVRFFGFKSMSLNLHNKRLDL